MSTSFIHPAGWVNRWQDHIPIQAERAEIEKWLEKFFALTTYEISIPVMRDETLAPTGKTGLIVSVLFDYQLTRQIEEMGWYEDFKSLCEKMYRQHPGWFHLSRHQGGNPAAIQLHPADDGKAGGQLGRCHHGMGIQQPSHASRKQAA